MFSEFGEVLSAHVQRGDSDDVMTRNGFVSFKQPEDAAKNALEAMNKKQMPDGSFLLVSQHVSKRSVDADGNTGGQFQKVMKKTFESNLFVKNVPSSVPE